MEGRPNCLVLEVHEAATSDERCAKRWRRYLEERTLPPLFDEFGDRFQVAWCVDPSLENGPVLLLGGEPLHWESYPLWVGGELRFIVASRLALLSAEGQAVSEFEACSSALGFNAACWPDALLAWASTPPDQAPPAPDG